MTRDDLKTMQAWSLQRKIQVTQTRIIEWYQHYEGKVYVSFSGGKDSTVLLDLARRVYPDIEAVFVDTGLEYPEIRQFVKQHDNVTILRPKMRFDEVIKKYGYPVWSKNVSQTIHKLRHNNLSDKYRNYLLNGDERGSLRKLPQSAHVLLDAPFECSDSCCKIMKHGPLDKFARQVGKYAITGTMTEESTNRENIWLEFGCNAFNKKQPISTPMSFWAEQDVLAYIKSTQLPYCLVYGDIALDNDGQTELFETTKHYHCTGCQRTGCMFCMFGVHLEKEPNRFQRMKVTHPKQYDYCINQLGLGTVLDYINVKY